MKGILATLARAALFLLCVRMAVTANWYGLAIRDQWGGGTNPTTDKVDWLTDTIAMSLHTVTYVPAQDTDSYFNNATNEVAAGGGYTAGGVTLASKTLTYDGPTNTVRYKAADVTWATATFTARIAVIRKNTGTSTTSKLMGYTNFGADQTPAGIDFVVKGDPTDGYLRGVVA